MLWLILLIILSINTLHAYLQKYLANRVSATRITLAMFGVSFLVALFFQIIIYQSLSINLFIPSIIGTAVINALATWLFIQAVRIHMVKSTLIIPLTSAVSIALLAIFLDEWMFLDPKTLAGATLLMGVVFGLIAMFLFGGNSKKEKNINPDHRKWLILIIMPILIWGFVNFLLKLFSTQEIATNIFLLSWYTGTMAGMLIILGVSNFIKKIILKKDSAIKEEVLSDQQPTGKFIFPALIILGFLTIGSLGFFYYALNFGPGILVLSAEEILKLTAGVLLGLFIFHERKEMRRRDWYGLGIGAAGIVNLIISSNLR